MLHFPKPYGLVVVLFFCVASLAACGKPETAEAPVRSVKVLTVGQSDVAMEFEFSGEVRARVETALGFRVHGKLLQRPAEIGQRVKAGQLLAELDPIDYRLAAVASTAQLASAQTNRDLAAADLKRYQGLFDQGFISSAELERRDSIYKAAQAHWQQAQAQNSVQGNQSSYTRLLADAAGVVTAVDANVGQVVAAGQTVVRLAVEGARDVWFSVPEDKLKYFATGDALQVRSWNDGTVLDAKVRDVAASADPVTRTFLVKAALADGAKPVLGSTVNVGLPRSKLASPKIVKLPTSALRFEGGKTQVWLLDGASMTVQSRVIEVTTADVNDAVVNSGLNNGDQVVVSGVHVLTSGQKVSVFAAPK
jgi:multidrug efflux system membrane fusion protein